jgi:hypothetical protein
VVVASCRGEWPGDATLGGAQRVAPVDGLWTESMHYRCSREIRRRAAMGTAIRLGLGVRARVCTLRAHGVAYVTSVLLVSQ